MPVEKAEGQKLKVFISYSRMDEEFAQELVCGLGVAGFEPYLDKHDIVGGEDWEVRLGRLLEIADTIVFVISPDAIASERCQWEVDRTVSSGKRLLPVVWRDVKESEVPSRLKRLNYIYFDKPNSFGQSLATLATALKTDLDWIREHTRLGELAARWNARSRVEALLLRGEELHEAQRWLARKPSEAPEPPELYRALLAEGHRAEEGRANKERQQLEDMAAAQAANFMQPVIQATSNPLVVDTRCHTPMPRPMASAIATAARAHLAVR